MNLVIAAARASVGRRSCWRKGRAARVHIGKLPRLCAFVRIIGKRSKRPRVLPFPIYYVGMCLCVRSSGICSGRCVQTHLTERRTEKFAPSESEGGKKRAKVRQNAGIWGVPARCRLYTSRAYCNARRVRAALYFSPLPYALLSSRAH